MCRELKRIIIGLAILILTFAFGILVVQVWQNSNRAQTLNETNVVISVNQTELIPKVKYENPCDYERMPPKVNNPKPKWSSQMLKKAVLIGIGVVNRRACIDSPNHLTTIPSSNSVGRVTIQILVDKEGYVRQAEAISGEPVFYKEAIEESYRARLEPLRLGGEPMNGKGTLIYKFAF